MSESRFPPPGPAPEAQRRSNVPELSVSELAFSMKKTLEDMYGRVRVRGELSRVKIHTSGHMYSDLKDQDAVMNVVCWKGTLAKLSVRPEEGLEVICTGRITTYPQRSNYQLVIEQMELAGEGALLKMLEDRRKKLAAEGLFAPERKRAIPFLPGVIGVVTSPTGAVIRDILHRLNDRFPRHVLVWPVAVQGPGAAEQVAAAIRGFNALPPGGAVPRPDLLIVARGGGSLEDLMAFNEEIVVRAAAESAIPLIAAVGHETDVTLIDHAADRRSPTPTAAAEIAVPRRVDLWAQIRDADGRLSGAALRLTGQGAERLAGLSARLGAPSRLLESRIQALDYVAHKMDASFERMIAQKGRVLAAYAPRLLHPRGVVQMKAHALSQMVNGLSRAFERQLAALQQSLGRLQGAVRPPQQKLQHSAQILANMGARLASAYARMMQDRAVRLAAAGRMLDSLSFENVLERGYVVVRDGQGRVVSDADSVEPGAVLDLRFRKGGSVEAVVSRKGPQKS